MQIKTRVMQIYNTQRLRWMLSSSTDISHKKELIMDSSDSEKPNTKEKKQNWNNCCQIKLICYLLLAL